MRVPPFKPSTGPSTDPAEIDQDKSDQKLKPTKSPCADPPNLPKKRDDPDDNPSNAPTLENNISNSREDLKKKILMSLRNTPILKTKEAGSNDSLLDSGANVHCSTSTQGMINLQTISGPVTVGDSREVQSMGKGDLPLETEDGTRVILHDTRIIHDFQHNIVSLPILLSRKCIVKTTSYRTIEIICSGGSTLRFHRRNDNLYYMSAKRYANPPHDISDAFVNSVSGQQRTIDINHAHLMLNHAGETKLREAANFNWRLTGTFNTCVSCTRAKAQKADTNKTTEKTATYPGKQLFWDMTGPFTESFGKHRYMAALVDQNTGHIFHAYLQTKNQSARAFREIINKLLNKKIEVKYVRMDNAGENRAVAEECRQHNIKVEHTSPYTPQYNGIVEQMFPTVKGQATAMLSERGVE